MFSIFKMLFAGEQKGVSRCRYGGAPKQQAEGCKKIHAGFFLFISFFKYFILDIIHV
jgi:hypothetical protein